MNEIIDVSKEQQKQILIESMPKQYSKWQKLCDLPPENFEKESIVEIEISDTVYHGKCFINQDKKMPWRVQHSWYVFVNEVDDCYSYDLLKDRKCRVIPTDVQLNTFFEKKLKEIVLRGRHHLEETQKAYIDLQKLKGQNES